MLILWNQERLHGGSEKQVECNKKKKGGQKKGISGGGAAGIEV